MREWLKSSKPFRVLALRASSARLFWNKGGTTVKIVLESG